MIIAAVALSGVEVKPWEWFKSKQVELIEARASAFARNQWSANLRVVNETSRDIVVERVQAVFGAERYGRSCRKAQATRVLYPALLQRAGSTRDVPRRVRPGEGEPFEGGPNLDRLFGNRRRCPLPVSRFKHDLGPRENVVTFTVFLNNGAERTVTTKFLYQPRARVAGGGGGLCFPFPFC